jgi:hypothetical protein
MKDAVENPAAFAMKVLQNKKFASFAFFADSNSFLRKKVEV